MNNYYVHNVPGRLRVKIPHIKGNPPESAKIEELLHDLEGVEGTSVNDITGSIVIRYDATLLEPWQIMSSLKTNGHLPQVVSFKNQGHVETAGQRAREALGKALLGWALGETFEGSGLSFLAALI